MNNRISHRPALAKAVPGAVVLVLCALMTLRVARAADPLGLYLGAAFGQAHVRVRPGQAIPQSTATLGDLDLTHSAYKIVFGLRPLSFLGAEIAYMDLGKVSSRTGQSLAPASIIVNEERASQRGESAFVLFYLPVPIIDVYAKAGVARIKTDFGATYTGYAPGVGTCPVGNPNCGVLGTFDVARSTTDTAFAYGAGLQWKLGDWAVRGEYERFDAAGANPTLMSLGMTYWLP